MPQPPMLTEGAIFGSLNEESKQRVLDEVGRRAADMFKAKREAVIEAFNFRQLGSLDRYDMYKARSVEDWAAIKDAFPQDYVNQLRDYYTLERRIKAGQTEAQSAGKSGEFTTPNPTVGV